MTQIISLISIIVFSLGMITVGICCRKKSNTIDGFLLGGRKMGAWISAFSYGTAYFSAVIFVGYAGKHGWDIGIGSIWIGIGNALIGSLIAWLVLAKPTRTMTRRLEAKTMPELFHKRFLSKGLKIYSALIIFIFLLPYAASVYKGLGTLFSTIFPFAEEWVCMLIVAALTATYLMLGGYVATAINNFIQGIIMIIGVIAMIIVLLCQPEVGGISSMFEKLGNIDPQLTNIWGGSAVKFLLTNILLTSFGVWALPQMVHKYYTIKDDKNEIKRGAVISTAFALIAGCGAYFVGSMGRLFIEADAQGMPNVAAGYDGVVPALLYKVFSGNVFLNILLSIVLLLLLSASMSTLSSIVLTSSSAISVDLASLSKKDIEPKKQMLMTRILCVAFVILSFVFATLKISFIVNLMSFSWGVVAGCFIGPYIWGLYWKRTTKAGAWAGALSGFLVVLGLIIYKTATDSFAAATNMSPEFGVAAMLVSVIIVPLVSLCTKKYNNEHIEAVFGK